MAEDPLLLVMLCWTSVVAGILVWRPLSAARLRARRIGGCLPTASAVMASMAPTGYSFSEPCSCCRFFISAGVALVSRFTGCCWGFMCRWRRRSPTWPGWRRRGSGSKAQPSVLTCRLRSLGQCSFVAPPARRSPGSSATFRVTQSRVLVPWVWTRAARVRFWLLLVLVPLEVVLFRSGGIQSPQNVIGVALVGWQWVLLNRLFAGARRPCFRMNARPFPESRHISFRRPN